MKTISIDEFVAVIDKAYAADGIITSYHEDDNVDHGDGLAKFIYHECRDVMGPELKTITGKEIAEAARAMAKARDEIGRVVEALDQLYCKVGDDNGQ